MNRAINDKILEQTNIGLSKEQIRANLLASGYDAKEVEMSLDSIFIDYPIQDTRIKDDNDVSWTSVLWGVFVFIVILLRLFRLFGS